MGGPRGGRSRGAWLTVGEELALLALAGGAAAAADIDERIRACAGRRVVSCKTVHNALARLLRDGLAERLPRVPWSHHRRFEYAVTPVGRAALTRAEGCRTLLREAAKLRETAASPAWPMPSGEPFAGWDELERSGGEPQAS